MYSPICFFVSLQIERCSLTCNSMSLAGFNRIIRNKQCLYYEKPKKKEIYSFRLQKDKRERERDRQKHAHKICIYSLKV